MKATHDLFISENFDRQQLKAGFTISMLINERQQDVFYLLLVIQCPAMRGTPVLTVPIRIDGREALPIELGGSVGDAQGIDDRDVALTVARACHDQTVQVFHRIFTILRKEAGHGS